MITHIEFRQNYEAQHPASVPRFILEPAKYPEWLPKVVLMMYGAAALLSGVHTVATVRVSMSANQSFAPLVKDVVSLASFIAIELALLVSAYAMLGDGKIIAIVAGLIAFLIAVIANLQDISTALATHELGGQIVIAGIGIGAPLIALLAGKMFVDMHKAKRIQQYKAQQQFDKDNLDFDNEVNVAWLVFDAQQRLEYEQERQAQIEREDRLRQEAADAEQRERDEQRKHEARLARLQANIQSRSVNEQSEQKRSVNSSTGYSKRMDAQTIIHEWLSEHRERIHEPLDNLVDAIEKDTGVRVGRTSIHNVRSSNGFTHE